MRGRVELRYVSAIRLGICGGVPIFVEFSIAGKFSADSN